MIIIKVMGGLGNQLQQYALYKKLESLGREVRLDVSWYRNQEIQECVLAKRALELDYFEKLSYREASAEEIRSVLGRLWEEKESAVAKLKRKINPSSSPYFMEHDMYHEKVFDFTNKYMVGYWACEKYYADILKKLRETIRFPESNSEHNRIRNKEIIQRMNETDSVSVHIRRGDYLEPQNRDMFGGICTDAYYETAIAIIKERYPRAKFFIFSDDTAYVREKYQGDEYEIIDWNRGTESFYDMMLMSHCKHNICANSTFSFWGARLNDNRTKIEIRPSIHKNTQVCIPDQMKDLWKDWVLITPQGEVL